MAVRWTRYDYMLLIKMSFASWSIKWSRKSWAWNIITIKKRWKSDPRTEFISLNLNWQFIRREMGGVGVFGVKIECLWSGVVSRHVKWLKDIGCIILSMRADRHGSAHTLANPTDIEKKSYRREFPSRWHAKPKMLPNETWDKTHQQTCSELGQQIWVMLGGWSVL